MTPRRRREDRVTDPCEWPESTHRMCARQAIATVMVEHVDGTTFANRYCVDHAAMAIIGSRMSATQTVVVWDDNIRGGS